MKRYISNSSKINGSAVIRIDDGEYFNDVALGSSIGREIWDNYMQEDWESMIREAANYYAGSSVGRHHDAQKIMDRAYDEIAMQKEMEEEQAVRLASAPDYSVYVYEPLREDQQGLELNTSDVEKAVETWFKWSQSYPTCVAIEAKNGQLAMELLESCYNNVERLKQLAIQYRCPYKIDFIINAVAKAVNTGYISGFFRNLPDQVYPFALG